MRPTKLQHLEKENASLKNKLAQVKEVVNEMDAFTHVGDKWTKRDTIMFNLYGKLKNLF